jgi:arginyl-tRNA synthetase
LITEGESNYNDKIEATLGDLKKDKVAVESQGAWIVDLKDQDLGVALVQKEDGTTLYMTRDICAAKYRKEEYNFHKMLYVVGQPQELHFKQLFAILKRMGYKWADQCEHIKFGYYLGMSTRKGTIVFLDDVLDDAKKRALEKMKASPVGEKLKNEEEVADKIGRTAVIFNDLSQARIKDVEFNWDRMLSFEQMEVTADVDFSLLSEPVCRRILSLLMLYPEKVQEAARLHEPSVISNYLLQLGSALHASYKELRIIGSPEPLARARLLLYDCIKVVLKNGLHLLGIKALKRM